MEEPEVLETVTRKLERMTSLGSTWPRTGMKPGNLNASIEAIGQLADVHNRFDQVGTSDEEVNVSAAFCETLRILFCFIRVQLPSCRFRWFCCLFQSIVQITSHIVSADNQDGWGSVLSVRASVSGSDPFRYSVEDIFVSPERHFVHFRKIQREVPLFWDALTSTHTKSLGSCSQTRRKCLMPQT